jgi:hypothetical protein
VTDAEKKKLLAIMSKAMKEHRAKRRLIDGLVDKISQRQAFLLNSHLKVSSSG